MSSSQNAIARRDTTPVPGRELGDLFNLALDLLCVMTVDGYFTRVNLAFERTLGYTSAQLCSRPCFDFVHPEDLERTRAALAVLARGEELHRFENRYIRGDGSECRLQWNSRPGPGDGVICAAAREVSHSREREEHEATRWVATLLAGGVPAGEVLDGAAPDKRRLEVLATAITKPEFQAGLARQAEEQAALRRAATLIARGAAPHDVFAAVTEEIGRLLAVDLVLMGRYEPDDTVSFLQTWSPAGDHRTSDPMTLGGKNLTTSIGRTGHAARIDPGAEVSGPLGEYSRELGIRSAIGAPVIVEGRLWGVMIAASRSERPLPEDTNARLADFTELVATSIANAESRARLARLAEEQAALRRVATLAARGARPEDVFAAVTEEVGRLLPVDFAHMGRYEPDGTISFVAAWGCAGPVLAIGSRLMLGGKNVGTVVLESGRQARIDSHADASGPLAIAAREAGIRSAVATPIIVEGRIWGAMSAGSFEQPLAANTEARLAEFTELVATAIANAESRAALAASRARIVTAADQSRRRIERDLHDGTQQRLVSLGLELRAAQAAVPAQLGELERELSRVADGLGAVFDELREISRGIHPAILSDGGLGPALRALARRSGVPVELDLPHQSRLPECVEVAAYYVVSEALTNAAKHAHASVVRVTLEAHNTSVRLAIRDDGIGGADPGRGSGLVGLIDRVEALDGTLEITSPVRGGTTLLIEIPIKGETDGGSGAT